MAPDLSKLSGESVQLPPGQVFEAVVNEDATEPDQLVTCVIPSVDPSAATDPCAWMPYTTGAGTFYPKKGDRAKVSENGDGPGVIIWWKPSASRIAVVKEAPINIEHPEYGADGTGATYSDEAFEKALAAMPTKGEGGILAPRRYKLSKPLDFDDSRSITVEGINGLEAGGKAASSVTFTQAGSTPAISARSNYGFRWKDLAVYYSNESFTGFLFDFSHSAEGEDSAFFGIERSELAGLSEWGGKGLNLDKAIIGSFTEVYFQNLDIAAVGQKEAGRYSNRMDFMGGACAGIGTIPFKNAGEAWYIRMTFENLHSGAAGAYTSDPGVLAAGLKFDTCWCGDATKAEGTWITFRGTGLTVVDGSLGSGALGIYVPDSASEISSVKGVRFISITDAIRANFGEATIGAGAHHYDINPNGYVGVSGKKVSLDNGTTDLGAVPVRN